MQRLDVRGWRTTLASSALTTAPLAPPGVWGLQGEGVRGSCCVLARAPRAAAVADPHATSPGMRGGGRVCKRPLSPDTRWVELYPLAAPVAVPPSALLGDSPSQPPGSLYVTSPSLSTEMPVRAQL